MARAEAAGSRAMWTLYDMDSGEVIASSSASHEPVPRPLPLYAPGAATCLCPLTVTAATTPRQLPREVVLSAGTVHVSQPSRTVTGTGSSPSPAQGPCTQRPSSGVNNAPCSAHWTKEPSASRN